MDGILSAVMLESYGSTFQWVAGVTPLTDLTFIFWVWIGYWTSILALTYLMNGKQGFAMTTVSALHNLILCAWSALMFFWVVVDVYRIVHKGQEINFQEAFCLTEAQANDPKRADLNLLFFHMYIYYVSKFYELLDTMILCLKARKPIFLHWYHHSIVIIQVWLWIHFKLTYASIGMMFNTFVHIFMYWYYFCATLKINVWFKRYITKLQIVQFITSFVLSVPYLYYHFQHGCVGMEAYTFSFFTNASFLLLFINFNNKTYHKKDTKKE